MTLTPSQAQGRDDDLAMVYLAADSGHPQAEAYRTAAEALADAAVKSAPLGSALRALEDLSDLAHDCERWLLQADERRFGARVDAAHERKTNDKLMGATL